MSVKGNWIRPIDPRFKKQFEKTQQKLFGNKCRLPHAHDKQCKKGGQNGTTKKKNKTND